MGFTQDGRNLEIITPLGKDVLLIDSLSVSEGISRLFVIDVQVRVALGDRSKVRVEALLGNGVLISLALPQGGTRHFHGLVSRFSEGGEDDRFRYYYAQVVPWLWLLTLVSNCRIFQNLSAPKIIEKVFKEHGLSSDVRIALNTGDYTTRDYCVQYRETDFNFVSRLMEEEGIFYFFEVVQDPGSNTVKHKLVIADSFSQLQPCPDQPIGKFLSSSEAVDHVTSWQMTHSLRAGQVILRDYHFQLSNVIQEIIEFGGVNMGGNQKLEVYDYSGDYAEKFNALGTTQDKVEGEGRRTGRLRMEEEETPHLVFGGSSFCRGFTAGFNFTLTNHSDKMDGSYVLTAVQHSAQQSPGYVSDDIHIHAYSNSFSCVRGNLQYRPARVTPKPVVQGVQTAEVSGPKSPDGKYKEEIWTDEYGRILVTFHWDRQHKNTGSEESADPAENSSAWVRVVQPWAGKNFGVIFIPRTGQEVVVDFEEGDPDRPIVVGSVYNNRHKPPYTLTANKTQSGIKTRSSKDGTPDNFNEIRFEDKKGHEELHIHAERNLSTVVEASESRSVGGSRSTTIQKNDTLTIKNGNRTETLENGNDSLTLKNGSRTETLENGNDSLTLKNGNRTTTLENGNDSLKATLGNITIEAPAGKYSVSAKDVEITGTTSVKIVCGASSIEMTPASITIKSPTIEINATAITTVKGGLVKINC